MVEQLKPKQHLEFSNSQHVLEADPFYDSLSALLPPSANSLSRHLHGSFNSRHKAVIPEQMGRITSLHSHESEYAQLLKYQIVQNKVRSYAVKQSFLPVYSSQRFNQYNHHKSTHNSPGVVRIIPKSFRSNSIVAPNTTRNMISLSPMKPSLPVKLKEKLSMTVRNIKTTEKSDIESYKGENMDGRRHGKGTAIYSNKDVYKGTWANNMKNGHGSYYYKTLGMVYKGEWSDDKRSGQGVLKFRNGNKVRGIWEDNELKNTVSFKYASGDSYTGSSFEGMKHGKGTYKYASDSVTYTGSFEKDLRSGDGILEGTNFYFEGRFKHDSTIGPGVLIHKNAFSIEKPSELAVSEFTTLKVTSADIVYVSMTKTQLNRKFNPPTAIENGEFVGGKLWGAGIAYYGKYGTYVGNFIDGERSGWGHFTYTDPQFQCPWTQETLGEYEGSWQSGQRQGFGTMKWPNGLVYEGVFKKDKRNQVTGTMKFPQGDLYEGGWAHNLPQGTGKMTLRNNIVVYGQFLDGVIESEGKIIFPDGKTYEGGIANYEPHGKGIMQLSNGIYSGSFWRGSIFGRGTMKYTNGDVYDGSWEDGMMSGKGEMLYHQSKLTYKGDWKDGLREGQGMLINQDEVVLYEGHWLSDRQEGFGKFLY